MYEMILKHLNLVLPNLGNDTSVSIVSSSKNNLVLFVNFVASYRYVYSILHCTICFLLLHQASISSHFMMLHNSLIFTVFIIYIGLHVLIIYLNESKVFSLLFHHYCFFAAYLRR